MKTRPALVLLILVASTVQVQSRRPQFGNLSFDVGNVPLGFTVADFNGDGRSDAVVTRINTLFSDLLTFEGSGDAFLTPTGELCCGFEAIDVATGDFNEDGILDVVAPHNGDETVTIYLGNGDGTFAAGSDFAIPDTGSGWVLAGDFSGDGSDDVIVGFTSGNPLFETGLMLGNGDGTLGPYNVIVGTTGKPSAGHFDADTDLDLVLGDRVYLNDGLGGFLAPIDTNVGIRTAVADFDGDGNLDIAGRVSFDLRVALGNGDGTFDPPVSYPTGVAAGDAAAGDVDNDGIVDLIASGDGLLIFRGVGDGTFQANQSIGMLDFAWESAVGDFDGDGWSDVITASASEVQILPGDGNGKLLNRVRRLDWTSVDPDSRAGTLADIDGDGREDMVVLDDTEDLFILYGRADGTFDSASSGTGNFPGFVSVAGGDLSGNGLTDIVVLADPVPAGPAGKFLRLLINLGNGNFTPGPGPTQALVTDNPSAMIAADTNADGKPDLIVTDEVTGQALVLIGLGNLLFASPVAYPVGAGPVALTTARVDGDVHLDLIVANRDSDDASVLLGNGDGTFQSALNVAAGDQPSSVATGDLNGDGSTDLVVGNDTSEDITVRLGAGNGTFGPDVGAPACEEHFIGVLAVATADFDRDGNVDVMLSCHETLELHRGNGDGTLTYESKHSASGQLISSDLDDDGWTDLISFKSPSYADYGLVLLNQGGPAMLAFDADGTTMRWPGVVGATSYNFYRGDLSTLTDGNLDGLPDSGYGICFSGSDPDTTDNAFSDGDVPALGGDGFFYVRSVVSAGGEDLGTTSGGLGRSVVVPCP